MPLDLHVLGFVSGVSLLAGLLFGVAPGILTSRVHLGESGAAGASTGSGFTRAV